MNCQDFWSSWPERGHEIAEEQESHLASCPACAAQWETHRAFSAKLGSLREDWRQEQAPDRVEAGLTAAFRMQTYSQGRRASRPATWTPVLAWMSAAAAMVCLGVVLLRGTHPDAVRPNTVAVPHHVTQSASEVAGVQEVEGEDDASVLGDGFVRLPNAPRLEPNEPYNVVQFAIPGSEIIALGLPINEERASETVLADVALGADGTARAVRLLDGGTFEE